MTIPYELAVNAFRWNSMVPEDRARQVIAEFVEILEADKKTIRQSVDCSEEVLTTELLQYEQGLERRYRAWLVSRSRTASTMVTGGSGFNVRRNSKALATESRRNNDFSEFRKRAMNSIRRRLGDDGVIRSSDPDAVTELEKKIAALESQQKAMRAANSVVRRTPKNEFSFDKLALLAVVLADWPEIAIRELFQPDSCGRYGFANYKLSNNSANIRRLKARLVQVGTAKQTENTVRESHGIRLEDCPAENRVRLFFPGKPAAEIIQRLKRNGFRWTPSLQCWQAYRNAKNAAETFIK